MTKKNDIDNSSKALFIQRLAAFLIDFFIISFIVSLISTPFVDTKQSEKVLNEFNVLVVKMQDSKIKTQDYVVEYSNIFYKLSRINGIPTLITLFLNVLYYVVFLVYNNGQTFGKKLLKIRVISEDGELSYNQLIVRSLIANFLFVDIVTFIFMLFVPRNLFFYLVSVLQIIQYIVIFISICMIVNREDGKSIHDLISGTRVVQG